MWYFDLHTHCLMTKYKILRFHIKIFSFLVASKFKANPLCLSSISFLKIIFSFPGDTFIITILALLLCTPNIIKQYKKSIALFISILWYKLFSIGTNWKGWHSRLKSSLNEKFAAIWWLSCLHLQFSLKHENASGCVIGLLCEKQSCELALECKFN